MNEFGAPETLDYNYVFFGGMDPEIVDLTEVASEDEGPAVEDEELETVDLTEDNDEGESGAAAVPLPTQVPVIELNKLKVRRDGKGYDVDLKVKNMSVQNSGQFKIFQNIDRTIHGFDDDTSTDKFSEAWPLGKDMPQPTDSFYVEPDWYGSTGDAQFEITAEIWVEQVSESLPELGYNRGTVNEDPWGYTFGMKERREIPLGTVYMQRKATLSWVNGKLETPTEERTYYRVEHQQMRELTDEEVAGLAMGPKRKARTRDEYNKHHRIGK